MSQGANIPYHLRTAKTADRSLFVDLLRRMERWHPFDRHVYVSMGGYPMADHHRVHRILGLQHMLSLEENPSTVPRQLFNRPTKQCRCLPMAMSEFVEDPQSAIAQAGILAKDYDNHIVWLDYTVPAKLRSQLDEFAALIRASDHRDIIRVTLNANYRAVKGGGDVSATRIEKAKGRLDWLRRHLGNLFPEDTTVASLSDEAYPRLLSRILRNVASRSTASNSKVVPLSLVTYADGQRMLAATMAIASDEETEEDVRSAANLNDWPLVSRVWDEVHDLRIATLTGRERAFLDRNLPTVPARKLLRDLKFDLFEGQTEEQAADYLERYGNLLRFYPNFVAID